MSDENQTKEPLQLADLTNDQLAFFVDMQKKMAASTFADVGVGKDDPLPSGIAIRMLQPKPEQPGEPNYELHYYALDPTFFNNRESQQKMATTVGMGLTKNECHAFIFTHVVWTLKFADVDPSNPNDEEDRAREAREFMGGLRKQGKNLGDLVDDPRRREMVAMEVFCATGRHTMLAAELQRHEDGTGTLGEWTDMQKPMPAFSMLGRAIDAASDLRQSDPELRASRLEVLAALERVGGRLGMIGGTTIADDAGSLESVMRAYFLSQRVSARLAGINIDDDAELLELEEAALAQARKHDAESDAPRDLTIADLTPEEYAPVRAAEDMDPQDAGGEIPWSGQGPTLSAEAEDVSPEWPDIIGSGGSSPAEAEEPEPQRSNGYEEPIQIGDPAPDDSPSDSSSPDDSSSNDGGGE